MAIIDTLRFRNILVNGDIAEEEAAQEFVTALDETFEEQLDGLATKRDIQTLRAEMAQMRAELMAEIRALEARMTRTLMFTAFGLFAALGTLMTLLHVFVD